MKAPIAWTIIIPTYNRPAYCKATVEQALDQLDAHNVCGEVIVIDQGELVASEVRVLAEGEPRVRYLHTRPANLPRARNIGISEARGAVIIWLDDDVLLPHDFLGCYVQEFAEPSVDGVAGQVYHRPLGNSVLVNSVTLDNFRSCTTPHFAHESPISMVGANHAIRRAVALRVGGYDENFIGAAHYEDSDFYNRCSRRGAKITYCPGAYVVHLRAPSGGCRVGVARMADEYGIVHGSLLYAMRYKRGAELVKTLLKTLRAGPLRKQNLIRWWRQPWAWIVFGRALRASIAAASEVRSPLVGANNAQRGHCLLMP